MSAEPEGLRGTEVVYMRMRYRRGTLVVCAQQRKPTKNASPRAEQRNLPPPHCGIGERGLTPQKCYYSAFSPSRARIQKVKTMENSVQRKMFSLTAAGELGWLHSMPFFGPVLYPKRTHFTFSRLAKTFGKQMRSSDFFFTVCRTLHEEPHQSTPTQRRSPSEEM
jgi:hypothetical protein